MKITERGYQLLFSGLYLFVLPYATKRVATVNDFLTVGFNHSRYASISRGYSSCRNALDPGSKVDVDQEEAVGK